MSLWEVGKIEGVTARVLQRVTEQAWKDHQTDEPQYCADIAPCDMPICDLIEPKGDLAFDRVSHARWNDETFSLASRTWKVTGYYGKWELTLVADETFTSCDFSEKEIADALNAQCPHPNPYVAVVELAYSTRGYRAGYGIRADGSNALFYN